MRLKSTEKLSHENVYKCYDDETGINPEDFKKMFTSCLGGGGGGGGGRGGGGGGRRGGRV